MTAAERETILRAIDQEGFDYTFTAYSGFSTVKDPEFQKRRQEYLTAREALKSYLELPAPVATCKFEMAYAGPCRRGAAEGSCYCEDHRGLQCVSCGKQATQQCDMASSLVCGAPLCDGCEHRGRGHQRKVVPAKEGVK